MDKETMKNKAKKMKNKMKEGWVEAKDELRQAKNTADEKMKKNRDRERMGMNEM